MKKRLEELPWTLFIDESSNKTQCGVGILLESPHGVVLRKALMIDFPLKNNQTKYEACIAGLEIVVIMEVQVLKVSSDSMLMINQLSREYQVKEPILQKYIHKIGVIKEKFKKLEFIYIPKGKM